MWLKPYRHSLERADSLINVIDQAYLTVVEAESSLR